MVRWCDGATPGPQNAVWAERGKQVPPPAIIKIDKYSGSRALKSFGVNGKYEERAGSIFIYLSRIS